ncbi:GOLPH3/VPS74 family protein [Microcella flavibacter]|uniref:GOLPH3/VPS74 family protein n=1 Tax=Microcella flavibacter TaxID=1804990 RepID=UPI00145696C7|nr:GPP34 family phosphoprotein [Microcella flavibacter]
MTHADRDDRTVTPDVPSVEQPTLAEDLLLLLFQPDSSTVAGENTLYYALAGAVVADLALQERVTSTSTKPTWARVEAVADAAPNDPLLLTAWEYVATKPRNVQTVLAAVGPPLREPLMKRLIARGDLVERDHRVLGMFPTTKLFEGGTGRREALLAGVREVLVDGSEPEPRVAALGALLYASGALPQMHREIPWTSAVITRAEELKRGNWGAGAAAQAIARTIASIVASNVFVATNILPDS